MTSSSPDIVVVETSLRFLLIQLLLQLRLLRLDVLHPLLDIAAFVRQPLLVSRQPV